MWTGKIDKKYGVSGKPGSKKDKKPPSSATGSAKQAATEEEHTHEGAEEEEKEEDPVVQPDGVAPKSNLKRKQKEAEPTEKPAARPFKRLRPLTSKSSVQDVTSAASSKKKKKKTQEQEEDQNAQPDTAEPNKAPEERKAETKAGQARKRQAKEKEEPAPARCKKSAKLIEVKKSKSSEELPAPPALPKAAPKRTAAKSQPSAPQRNTPDGGFDLMAESWPTFFFEMFYFERQDVLDTIVDLNRAAQVSKNRISRIIWYDIILTYHICLYRVPYALSATHVQ